MTATIELETTTPACSRCRDELLHCHGTLVVHDDGGWDCQDPWCDGTRAAHTWVLPCADVGCDCAL